MSVIISMLRGINVGHHHRISMEDLRAAYESLKLRHAQTFIQSGNVVFEAAERDLGALASRIEDGLERKFGFRPAVVLRTIMEMRDVIARNPFAGRPEVQPNRLLVMFLGGDPPKDMQQKMVRFQDTPEELRLVEREIYIYFPDGMARPKLSLPALERALAVPSTGRNWNSVTKLLEMAEKLRAG